VNSDQQAIWLNAVPLLGLAALYLAAAAVLAASLRRGRAGPRRLPLVLALAFACVGIAAAIAGAAILVTREALAGDAWAGFAAILVALVPPLVLLASRGDREVLTGAAHARQAEELTSRREREHEALSAFAGELARRRDPVSIARLLLDETTALLAVDTAHLALVNEDVTQATGLLGRTAEGDDIEWFADVVIDFEQEPSAMGSAAREAAPVTVYDISATSRVARRIADRAAAKSGCFVPLIAAERVLGVVAAVTTRDRRLFSGEDVRLLSTLAAETALALDRLRSAGELQGALERERLVARIGAKVRSEVDLDDVLRVAVEETGRALRLSRCFVRLDDADAAARLLTEWDAPGAAAVADEDAGALPALNLAARERRTVAVDDVEAAPELADPALGSVDVLRRLGTRAVLATPILVYDRMIGVLGLHRPEPTCWSPGEGQLAEAVARELGLAVHTARLLDENRRRLKQESALLKAAEAIASELELLPVLQRLVDEVAQLVGGDAADCYLLDLDRGVLRCAAVNGLPEELVGFEFSARLGLSAQAIEQQRAVVATHYDEATDPVPHAAYEGFSDAVVAPVTWSGEVRGVLGVGTRGGGRFGQAEIDVLEGFAGLASLALRNAEAFEESTRQARVQRGFYRIAAALGRPVSIEATLDTVARAAAEALGGTSAAVLMPRAGAHELAAAQGLGDDLRRLLELGLAAAAPAVASAAGDGRVLASTALATDDRFDPRWHEAAERAGVRALLSIPLPLPGDDGGFGLVLVFFAEERRFSRDDLELARNLADVARGAIDRGRLFEAERTARELAQQLSRTTSLLATALDPAAVLDEVVQQAPALVGADAAAIHVLEADELVVTAAVGEGAAGATGERAPATGRLSGDVVQGRVPIAVPDARGDRRLLHADPFLAAGYAAYLGVPLVGPEGALHGALAVYANQPRGWREDEIDALGALAANASAALSNAELYQRVAVEKERSDAILANIADGIVAVDREGEVVLWNAAAEHITGVPQDEAIGRTPAQLLQRNLEAGADSAGGTRLVSIPRGGREVWLSLTEAIMRDPAGAVAGRIYAFRDISADRFVEQMKSDFVSTVSQELRRPLTSIYGFAETLLRRDVLFGEEHRRTFLGYIASESERLTAIVDALLNVARLDTGDVQVTLAPTDVAAVVAEVVSGVEDATLPDAHSFVVELPPEPIAAEADREKLRLILANLIDNAIKFSPAGGTVTVSARRVAETVEIGVADEGIGIPEAERERIFRKFYRADSAARQSAGGTGLGLFIAQGLVSAMGGRITVDSAEGRGSSFTVELPLAEAVVHESVAERV
jgi:two-component system phosphate regulon sensor histidine kinase PhoR